MQKLHFPGKYCFIYGIKKLKSNIIKSTIAVTFGLLISLGPQFLFKVCGIHDDGFPRCHWAGLAEIPMGIIIVVLGLCFILFYNLKIQFGLTIGILLTGVIALFIPHGLIRGCSDIVMACRRITFPVLTVLCIMVLTGSIVNMMYLDKKIKNADGAS